MGDDQSFVEKHQQYMCKGVGTNTIRVESKATNTDLTLTWQQVFSIQNIPNNTAY